MRRTYHIARADFLQRVRSRKLVVILAIIAYFGYLVNVGQIELAYQFERDGDLLAFHGTNTAEFVGLKAGLTGATVLLFGGFYMMNATLERDRRTNVDRLVASTTVTDRTYLLGKWLSNVGLAVLVLVVLGIATVLNHLVHGVGPTEPLALLGPIVVFALPVATVVAAVALVFESVDLLNGTGGNIAYFLLATFALGSLSVADSRLPASVPFWAIAIDPMGQIAVYELTIDALHNELPGYAGGPPSFGTLDAERTFQYTGHRWPAWVFLQRAWLVVPAFVVLLIATIPVEQLDPRETADHGGWGARILGVVPVVGGEAEDDAVAAEPAPVDTLSFTPVRDRTAGGFWRLVRAEFRLTIRGRRWWWYIGAAALVCWPLAGLMLAGPGGLPKAALRRIGLPLAFIWPIFLWSDMGNRVGRHRMTDLLYSSGNAVEQLLAEWLAGVCVAFGLTGGLLTTFVATGQFGGLLGIASGVLFGPSLAIAIGTWSRSPQLFELTYLLLWYAGPLNGGAAVDFVGATSGSVSLGVPIAFIGISAVLLAAGLFRRKRESA